MRNRGGFVEFLKGGGHGPRGLIALVAVSIIVNLVSGILQIATNNSVIVLVLTVVALLVSLVLVFRLPRRPAIDYLTDEQKPQTYPGLIVLVSKGRVDRSPQEQVGEAAIAYHAGQTGQRPALRHCWLIATAGRDGSLPYAQVLKQQCEALHITVHTETVADGFSIQETYDLVRRIYAEAPGKTMLAPSQIIADFTGGVKPMSVGMALACGGRYPMQYMYGGQPQVASTPRALKVTLS